MTLAYGLYYATMLVIGMEMKRINARLRRKQRQRLRAMQEGESVI